MSGIHRFASLIGLMSALAATAAEPMAWVSRGPGGGGAFFGCAFGRYNPDDVWVNSDMSDQFTSSDAGRTWSTVDFRKMQGGHAYSWMQFTSDPNIRYALNGNTPSKSLDGGVTWTAVPRDIYDTFSYCLFADDQSTNRLIISDYNNMYFSTNGGASYTNRRTSSDLLIAGAFWDGANIYVGTSDGLLVSTNGGSAFAVASNTGIPAGQYMVTFAGSKAGGTTRFFCVTMDGVWPGIQGYDYPTYLGTYRLDYTPTSVWVDGRGFFVAMSRTNVNVAWIGGSTVNGEPAVFRTTNGGASWQSVFSAVNNVNIQTGWSGDDPGAWNWRKWSYGEIALGFNVAPTDPQRAIIGDYGFVHITTNGGASWYAAYVAAQDLNTTNSACSKTNFYHGVGIEDTSCWHLSWPTSNCVFACYTDMRGIVSTNGGKSWDFPATLTYNSTYETRVHPTNGLMYGAMSSVHDMYAWDQYCQDSRIDSGSGEIMYSTNRGRAWARLHNFGRPVVALALDPNNPNRLYASMVNSASGGIFRTTNLGSGTNSTWARLPSPARTKGHPYVISILNDGAIVCSYSARITNGSDFEASSGVFISTDDGASWQDRTAANMMYYTKDVVIDPFDVAQNRWYAGVWGEWGSSSGKGGLYMTTNRGVAWTKISTNLAQVGSVTISPSDSNTMYVTTENDGLWFSTNRYAATPVLQPATNYPFRFPSRVFSNPWNSNEVWVTSFGNGLRLGRLSEPSPQVMTFSGAEQPTNLTLTAASGQRVALAASTNLVNWQDIRTNLVVDETVLLTEPPTGEMRFYRARVLP